MRTGVGGVGVGGVRGARGDRVWILYTGILGLLF